MSRKSGKFRRLKKQLLASPEGFFSLESALKKKKKSLGLQVLAREVPFPQAQCDPSLPRTIPPEAKRVRCLLLCEEGLDLQGPLFLEPQGNRVQTQGRLFFFPQNTLHWEVLCMFSELCFFPHFLNKPDVVREAAVPCGA